MSSLLHNAHSTTSEFFHSVDKGNAEMDGFLKDETEFPSPILTKVQVEESMWHSLFKREISSSPKCNHAITPPDAPTSVKDIVSNTETFSFFSMDGFQVLGESEVKSMSLQCTFGNVSDQVVLSEGIVPDLTQQESLTVGRRELNFFTAYEQLKRGDSMGSVGSSIMDRLLKESESNKQAMCVSYQQFNTNPHVMPNGSTKEPEACSLSRKEKKQPSPLVIDDTKRKSPSRKAKQVKRTSSVDQDSESNDSKKRKKETKKKENTPTPTTPLSSTVVTPLPTDAFGDLYFGANEFDVFRTGIKITNTNK